MSAKSKEPIAEKEASGRVWVELDGQGSRAGSEPFRRGLHAIQKLSLAAIRAQGQHKDVYRHARLQVEEPFQQRLYCGISEHAFRRSEALTGNGSAACD